MINKQYRQGITPISRGTLIGMLGGILGVIFLFSLPGSAHAAEIIYLENSYTLPADTLVEDNLIINSDEVFIDGIVQGDLIVAANTLEITGEVQGDVIALGNFVTIKDTATIAKNVRIAGTMITLDGSVGKNAYLFGSQMVVNSSIQGDMNVAGSTLDMGGTLGGTVYLNNAITTFREGSEIKGNVEYSDATRADFANVSIDGETINHFSGTSFVQKLMNDISDAFTQLIISFFFGMLILVIVPKLLYTAALSYPSRVGMHFIKGIGISLLLILAGLILLVGIFTIPIGLILLAFTLSTLYTGHIVFSFWLGLSATKLPADSSNTLSRSSLILLAGLTLYAIGQLIPVFNLLLSLWAIATGTGVLLQLCWNMRKQAMVTK